MPWQNADYAERVDQDGYAVVNHVLADETVGDLLQAVSEIPLSDEVRRRRNIFGIRNLLKVCPAVRDLASRDELGRWVTPVLGVDAFAVRAVYFDKVPDANWALGWHQDRVISVAERRDVPHFRAWSRKAGVWQVQPPPDVLAGMLAIRVHLDDCDASNGPLRVLPGSHCYGWLGDELDHWKQRVAETVCVVPRGGIVAMRPLLLHASSASLSARHRRVIHIEYACADLPGGLEWNQRVAVHNR